MFAENRSQICLIVLLFWAFYGGITIDQNQLGNFVIFVSDRHLHESRCNFQYELLSLVTPSCENFHSMSLKRSRVVVFTKWVCPPKIPLLDRIWWWDMECFFTKPTESTRGTSSLHLGARISQWSPTFPPMKVCLLDENQAEWLSDPCEQNEEHV